MGLFVKDEMTYFTPTVERDLKINNIQHWEQAFWVYAAIYSKANPSRVSEIWQYVHIINSAATTYQWSNIAEYDYTFRHLMSEYPARSWAKTYLQGLNLIMRDHVVRDAQYQSNKGFSKDNIYWPFNKGKCNDQNCPKDHRCANCGKWGHSTLVCRKKKKGLNSNNNNQNSKHGEPMPENRSQATT